MGPGRGSAAGSLVAYALRITDIDPIEYDLIFERFLNEERISPPDIDIDFCENRRGEVIEYVTRKYGRENVAQIITFGTMKAKAVVRDVGRVLDMPYAEVDKIAKMIPFDLKMTLDKALEESPALKDAYQKDARVKDLIDISRRLEGTTRHASTHAAGVVISPAPLTEFVPLASFKGNTADLTTQYDMHGVERIGLLKMDFLGLRTLTLIDDCVKMIEAQTGTRIEPDKIPLDDARTYELFTAGKTSGLFQFESDGMRDILRRFKPDQLEHLTALNALYRPGPMQMIDDVIRRRHGQTKVTYEHPALEPILSSTYGVMVYQEQVMKIASTLAGFTLGEADILRKAMGKKKADVMATQMDKFLKGCAARGVPEKKAKKIWDHMEQFAGYGFNKSALRGLRLARLPDRLPEGQLPGVLHGRAADLGARQHRQDGGVHRRVPRDGHPRAAARREPVGHLLHRGGQRHSLRPGRHQERGRGRGGGDPARARRAGPFRSLFDFCERVDLRAVNRRVVESFVKSGSFDSLDPRRAALFAAIDRAMEAGQKDQRDREQGQSSLFGGMDEGPQAAPAERIRDVPDWGEGERLAFEKESLGFFITGHPLERFRSELAQWATATTGRLMELADGREVSVGGIVTGLRPIKTRKGERMASFVLEDLEGGVEALVFPETYKKVGERLADDEVVLVKGKAEVLDEGKARLLVSDVLPLDQARLAEAPLRDHPRPRALVGPREGRAAAGYTRLAPRGVPGHARAGATRAPSRWRSRPAPTSG